MKRRLGLVALALTLTACGGGEEWSPPDAVNDDNGSVFDQSEGSSDSTDEAFVSLLQMEYPNEFGLVPSDDLVDLGHSVCIALDNGLSFADAVDNGVEVGYSYEETGFLIGASIGAYCIEHEGVIP